jgi:GST-like protein
MASVGWSKGWKRYGQDIAEFPHFARWLDAVMARPAVQRGLALDIPNRKQHDLSTDEEARKILFGQRAR